MKHRDLRKTVWDFTYLCCNLTTLLLNFEEINQIRREAARLWPGESVSKTEVLRRFVLAGVRAARSAKAAKEIKEFVS